MVVTIIRHRVADFSAWKQSYDSVADVQREGGVRSQSVLTSLDDPNVVVITQPKVVCARRYGCSR